MRPFGKKREIYVLILNDAPPDVWCAVVYDVLSPEMDLLYFSDRDSLRDSVVMEREDSTDQIKHQNMQNYWNTETQGSKTTAARNTQTKQYFFEFSGQVGPSWDSVTRERLAAWDLEVMK